MAQFRPFAIKPEGAPDPSGTTSIGFIVIGVDQNDYYNNHGGLNWIAGPDEELGIIIAYHDTDLPLHSHSSNPMELYNIGFLRADNESEFVALAQKLGAETANTGLQAKTWLNNNGYWTSFNEEYWAYGYTLTPSLSNGWYFYSGQGPLDVGPPDAFGNAIFLINNVPPNGNEETFNPNKSDGTDALFFNLRDVNGIDYSASFSILQNNGGTLAITQNGQTATYTSGEPNAFEIQGDWVIVKLDQLTQITSTDGPFTFVDSITLAFS